MLRLQNRIKKKVLDLLELIMKSPGIVKKVTLDCDENDGGTWYLSLNHAWANFDRMPNFDRRLTDAEASNFLYTADGQTPKASKIQDSYSHLASHISPG